MTWPTGERRSCSGCWAPAANSDARSAGSGAVVASGRDSSPVLSGDPLKAALSVASRGSCTTVVTRSRPRRLPSRPTGRRPACRSRCPGTARRPGPGSASMPVPAGHHRQRRRPGWTLGTGHSLNSRRPDDAGDRALRHEVEAAGLGTPRLPAVGRVLWSRHGHAFRRRSAPVTTALFCWAVKLTCCMLMSVPAWRRKWDLAAGLGLRCGTSRMPSLPWGPRTGSCTTPAPAGSAP